MTLKNNLIKNIPREKSGSKTGNRYVFQWNYAICLLIKHFKLTTDFLILLDYHDDIVVLNSSINPSEASFYQVKTKQSGDWKISDLIKRKDNQLSFLGKLYLQKITFKKSTKSLNFVSNCYLNTNLQNNCNSKDKEEICFSELMSQDIRKISNAIKKEHSLKTNPSYKNITFYIKSDLSLEDSTNHAKGKLVELFESIRPNCSIPMGPIYNTLFDDIAKRTNYDKNIDSWDKVSNTSISKEYFSNYIEKVLSKSDTGDIIGKIENQLTIANVNIITRRKILHDCRKVQIDLLDPSNSQIHAIQKNALDIIEQIDEASVHNNFIELLDILLYELKNKITTYSNIHTDSYLKAIILVSLYEG